MVSRRRREGEESASIAAVVNDAVYLVKVANPMKAVEIDVPVLAENLRVAASKVQVQQVLMNLLRNALEAASDASQPLVAIRAEVEAGSLLICVDDNGPGFPPGAEDSFAPFAAETSRGLGLGLSISKTIVEAYGGSIWLERRAPVGATVCFRLPLAA
jgi:two-component system sensor kinase FixL